MGCKTNSNLLMTISNIKMNPYKLLLKDYGERNWQDVDHLKRFALWDHRVQKNHQSSFRLMFSQHENAGALMHPPATCPSQHSCSQITF